MPKKFNQTTPDAPSSGDRKVNEELSKARARTDEALARIGKSLDNSGKNLENIEEQLKEQAKKRTEYLNELRRQLRAKEEELTQEKQRSDTLQSNLSALEMQLAEHPQQIQRLDRELTELRNQLARENQKNLDTQTLVGQLQQKIQEIEKDRSAITQERDQYKSLSEQQAKELQSFTADLKAEREDKIKFETQLQKTLENLAKIKEQLEKANKEISVVRSDLGREKDVRMQAVRAGLEQQRRAEELQNELGKLQAQVAAQEQAASLATQRLRELEEDTLKLTKELQRTKDLLAEKDNRIASLGEENVKIKDQLSQQTALVTKTQDLLEAQRKENEQIKSRNSELEAMLKARTTETPDVAPHTPPKEQPVGQQSVEPSIKPPPKKEPDISTVIPEAKPIKKPELPQDLPRARMSSEIKLHADVVPDKTPSKTPSPSQPNRTLFEHHQSVLRSEEDTWYKLRAIKVGKKNYGLRTDTPSLSSPDGMENLMNKMQKSITKKASLAGEKQDSKRGKEREILQEEYTKRQKERFESSKGNKQSITFEEWLKNRKVKGHIFENVKIVPIVSTPPPLSDNPSSPATVNVNKPDNKPKGFDILISDPNTEGPDASPRKKAYVQLLENEKEIELGFTSFEPGIKEIEIVLENAREIWRRTGDNTITFSNFDKNEKSVEAAAKIEELGKDMGLNVQFDSKTNEALKKWRDELKPPTLNKK